MEESNNSSLLSAFALFTGFCILLQFLDHCFGRLYIGKSLIYFWVLQLVVLVQAALRSIRFLTIFYRAFIKPFDLVSSTSESFIPVMEAIRTTISFFILSQGMVYLIFAEPGSEMFFLIN